MTPKRLEFLMGRLDINAAGLARFANAGARTVYRWLDGDSEIPQPLAMLLEVMHARGVTASEAYSLAVAGEVPPFNAKSGRPGAAKASASKKAASMKASARAIAPTPKARPRRARE